MNARNEDLLNDDDRRRVRALEASRARDRGASCHHQVLVKVVDRLGLMTSCWVNGELVTAAPVLEAHYECRDCGAHLLSTENTEAKQAYDTYLEAGEKFGSAIEAIDVAWKAMATRKERKRR